MKAKLLTLAVVSALTAWSAFGQPPDPSSLQISFSEGQSYSVPIQILVVLTLLSFLPAMLISVTCFTRIIVVAHFLRQAIGTQSAPSNQILIGLALFLTLFVMGPTWDRVYEQAVVPYQEGKIGPPEALEKAAPALREFMLRQVREKDLALFVKISGMAQPATVDDVPLRVVIPAFMISELKTAFQIGFVLFLPFLVIDMVISSILLSSGMMMLPPVVISTPFKILLFILVDGWNLVIGSLVQSFR
jgi:flagellar biosynthesis protein FliP